jgi:hypothetical protein
MNRKNFCIFLVIIITISSCKIYKEVELPKQKGLVGYNGGNTIELNRLARSNSEKLKVYDIEKEYIRNSNNLNWGLAISGGGIRSATYNMGALKALYDRGILDSIQIISSVSGGGYLSYWLFTNYYNNKHNERNFGYFSFHDSVFLKNITLQQGKARFLPKTRTAGALLDEPNGAFETYRSSIESTYGHNVLFDLPISILKSDMILGRIPYFIINTTIASRETSDWLSSIFEFTPLFQGNPEVSFKVWESEYSFEWSRAVAISGAAIKFKLLHEIPNYSKNITNDYIPLSDGGHSENLGAIALIRRGVKNIIILDAGYNHEYSFDAYKNLKQKLKQEMNLTLAIDGIDSFIERKDSIPAHSVYKGSVKSVSLIKNDKVETFDINIYYVKMSLSQDIKTLLSQDSFEIEGKELNQTLVNQSCVRYNGNDECVEYDAENLHGFESMNLINLFTYWVRSYSDHINNHPIWQRIGYTFPHTTTSDQTFYRDQFAAFVGLGYLQTSTLDRIISD